MFHGSWKDISGNGYFSGIIQQFIHVESLNALNLKIENLETPNLYVFWSILQLEQFEDSVSYQFQI